MPEINPLLTRTTPLSSYVASPMLKRLVENASDRTIPSTLSRCTVLLINWLELPEGTVFAGEIGQSHNRRDYNAPGVPVNRAAHVMSQTPLNQIWMTAAVVRQIERDRKRLNVELPFTDRRTGELQLKGSPTLTPIFQLFLPPDSDITIPMFANDHGDRTAFPSAG